MPREYATPGLAPDRAELLVWDIADAIERAPNRQAAAVIAEAAYRAVQMTVEALQKPNEAHPALAPRSAASATVRATVESGTPAELAQLATTMRRMDQQLGIIEQRLEALQGAARGPQVAQLLNAIRTLEQDVRALGGLQGQMQPAAPHAAPIRRASSRATPPTKEPSAPRRASRTRNNHQEELTHA